MSPEVLVSDGPWFPCSVGPSCSSSRSQKRGVRRKRAQQRAREALLAAQLTISPNIPLKLQYLRYQAHQAFDPLWKGETASMTRHQAYLWLAQTLNLPTELTHIGMFSEAQCKTVIAAMENRELLEQMNSQVRWGEVQKRRLSKRTKSWEVYRAREEKLMACVK